MERVVVRTIRKEPKTSSTQIQIMLRRDHGTVVCSRTVQKTLNRHGYHSRTSREKPLISNVNRQKRIEFVKLYLDRDLTFWKSVIFTDESQYNVFGHDGPSKVWRKKGTAMEIANLRCTIKYGGGGVLVWECMAWSGVGNLVFIDGIMDKWHYLNILKANLHASVEQLGLPQGWVFQQHNDPKHTALVVREWLLYNTPKQLHSPPQSPDLNPIEHLWDYVERQLHKHTITSKATLKEAIRHEWARVPPEFTQKLVSSMNNRLKAVLDSKGGPTRY